MMVVMRAGGRDGNLPAETTSFVGRRVELAQLGRLLVRSRLVTLTGVGGVGKSRLALRAAAQARAEFPDGAWLVQLSPLQDPALLGHTISEALELADQTVRPQLEVLAGYLAGRRLLLILDTCEHLAAACAETAATLLRAAPGLTIFATSRQPLDLPGEQVVMVGPLPVPGPGAAAGSLGDAAELFADRAAAASGFAVTEQNRGHVLRLCRRLDGIPLAIELAAVRLPDMPLEQLAARLEDRFALLGGGLPEAPPRHQTLRTAIGWSHELCEPLERLLWARLSVFAGGFGVAAAQQVCADEQLPIDLIPELLMTLAGKSILRRADTQSETRYRLLDTVRDYGAEWLRTLGTERAVLGRHRDFYLRLARQGEAEWCGPDQLRWRERMSVDHPNIRAALDFCLAEPAEYGAALEFAGTLWFVWWCCGFVRDGRYYLDRILALSQGPDAARARAIWAHGLVAVAQGDAQVVADSADEALALAAARDDHAGVASGTYLLGVGAFMRGDLEVAAGLFRDAADRHADAGVRIGYLLALSSLAVTLAQLGEFDRAVAVHEEQAPACSEHGELWARAFGDFARGVAELGRGDIGAAVTYTRASLKVKHSLGDILGIALDIDVLATAAGAAGQGECAAQLLGSADQIWASIGLPQMGTPGFIAAREGTERCARKLLGDEAYKTAYQAGYASGRDASVSYALKEASALSEPES
jgi:predicted ATPase